MEVAGLVDRRASYGDRRQRTAHLTPEGWSRREAVMSDFRDFNAKLTRGLSEAEIAAVLKFLDRSVENVE